MSEGPLDCLFVYPFVFVYCVKTDENPKTNLNGMLWGLFVYAAAKRSD